MQSAPLPAATKAQVLGSLIPLYLGRTASFVVEMQTAGLPR